MFLFFTFEFSKIGRADKEKPGDWVNGMALRAQLLCTGLPEIGGASGRLAGLLPSERSRRAYPGHPLFR